MSKYVKWVRKLKQDFNATNKRSPFLGSMSTTTFREDYGEQYRPILSPKIYEFPNSKMHWSMVIPGLIYGRYLQFRFLKWPVNWTSYISLANPDLVQFLSTRPPGFDVFAPKCFVKAVCLNTGYPKFQGSIIIFLWEWPYIWAPKFKTNQISYHWWCPIIPITSPCFVCLWCC